MSVIGRTKGPVFGGKTVVVFGRGGPRRAPAGPPEAVTKSDCDFGRPVVEPTLR